MKLKFKTEICCEECNSPIHIHFECPVCKDKHAGTGMYGQYVYEVELGETFTCEECDAEFKLIKKSDFEDSYEWEQMPR